MAQCSEPNIRRKTQFSEIRLPSRPSDVARRRVEIVSTTGPRPRSLVTRRRVGFFVASAAISFNVLFFYFFFYTRKRLQNRFRNVSSVAPLPFLRIRRRYEGYFTICSAAQIRRACALWSRSWLTCRRPTMRARARATSRPGRGHRDPRPSADDTDTRAPQTPNSKNVLFGLFFFLIIFFPRKIVTAVRTHRIRCVYNHIYIYVYTCISSIVPRGRGRGRGSIFSGAAREVRRRRHPYTRRGKRPLSALQHLPPPRRRAHNSRARSLGLGDAVLGERPKFAVFREPNGPAKPKGVFARVETDLWPRVRRVDTKKLVDAVRCETQVGLLRRRPMAEG